MRGIAFTDSTITIDFDFAHVLVEHPWNNTDRHICIEPVRLEFLGVTSSTATLNRSVPGDPIEHPNPMNPINDVIMEANENPSGSCFEYTINGLFNAGKNSGWVEWKIVSEGFEVLWGSWGKESWMTDSR